MEFNPAAAALFGLREPKRLCCGAQTTVLFCFFLFPFSFPSLLKVVLQLCIYTLHITSLITIITAHINTPGVVSPFYSTGNWGSEGLNNGLWLPN